MSKNSIWIKINFLNDSNLPNGVDCFLENPTGRHKLAGHHRRKEMSGYDFGFCIFKFSITLSSIAVSCFFCFLNGPTPASFSFILGLSQTNITNFYNKYMWKKYPSSIRCWDSNPRPSEPESPPITTRPGLPLLAFQVSCIVYFSFFNILRSNGKQSMTTLNFVCDSLRISSSQ